MAKRICSIEGCQKPVLARGWCGTHYALWRRNGVPRIRPRPTESDRFWAKVDLEGPVSDFRPDLGPCWIWRGALSKGGYGQFLNGGDAHRWAWIEANGPVEPGKQLDHLCRTRPCVRPAHLEPVTVRENVRRGAGTGGVLYERKTHCRQGHAFEGNSFTDKNGTVRCFICHYAAQARHRAKKRANGISGPHD